jgi:hypothetical protein|tara:strand:+ start:39 stop:188 length:150 start_codon:yes stop_codon:yes gene_type:complete
MIEIIDLILNQYLRILVGVILIGLIIFSLFFKLKNKYKKKSNIKIENKD